MGSVVVALVAGAAVVGAAPSDHAVAQAQESACHFNSSAGTLSVDGEGLGAITVARSTAEKSDQIEVRYAVSSGVPLMPGASGTLNCADQDLGVELTVTTVDAVTVQNTLAFFLDLSEGALVPGRTVSDEAGAPEIEVTYDAPPPRHGISPRLSIDMPPPAPDGSSPDIHLGSLGERQGANLNPRAESPSSADADVLSAPVAVSVSGTSAPDEIDGSGGPGFRGPLEGPLGAGGGLGDDRLATGEGRGSLDGGDGDDRLLGSATAGDKLTDGRGDDVVRGFGGDDDFNAWRGNDRYLAGAGDRDELWPEGATGGIHVDLRKSGPQDAASLGTDTFRGFEWLSGTARHDVLIGDSGPNLLFDNNGADDRLVGNGGDDRLFGSYGEDSLFGGPGADRLFGGNNADELSGGTDADRLNASGGDDRLLGGLGADIFLGGADADRLLARDGHADRRIDCGPGSKGELVQRDPEDPAPVRC